MNYINIKEAIELHEDVIRESGGLNGYNKKSIGYLESALEHIQNDDLYPEFVDKICHIIFACVKFHPFLDANKRTSLYLAKFFIMLNDVCVDEDFFVILEDIVVELAESKIEKDELREILQNILI